MVATGACCQENASNVILMRLDLKDGPNSAMVWVTDVSRPSFAGIAVSATRHLRLRLSADKD